MDNANKFKAAMAGALGFVQVRDEVVEILVERLTISDEGQIISGHDECAERIILLFAELVNGRPSSNTEG